LSSDELEISVHISGDLDKPSVFVVLVGAFDGRQARRFDEVAASVPRNASSVSVDLGETTLIDSAALGALIRLKRSLDGRGVEYITKVSRPFQSQLLRMGGLTDYLAVVEPGRDGSDGGETTGQ